MSIPGSRRDLYVVFLVSLIVQLAGCDDGDTASDIGEDVVTDTTTDAPSLIVLSGLARRTAELVAGGDGIGTLCAQVVDECPTPENLSPTVIVSGMSVPDADLAEISDNVSFRFEIDTSELPNGYYALFGYLHEDGGTCDNGPASGDPVSVLLLGGAACPELEITGAGLLDDLELYLNATAP